jgi:glycosyltransferase 2 family protein
MSAVSRSAAILRARLAGRLVKVVVVGVAVAIILAALKGYGEQLVGRLEHVSVGRIAAALGMCLVYRIVNAYGWVMVLRALGQPTRAWAGVRIWLVSESLRWLPGSVWGMISRVTQASAAGVPTLTASLSVPLELILTIVAWSIAAAVGLGASGTLGTWLARVPTFWAASVFVGGLVTVGAALVLARWVPSSRFSKKLRGLGDTLQQLRRSPPDAGWLAATLLFFTALAFFNGAIFMAVLSATCDSHPGLFASTGINAAGWLLGFFAFFAPSGLGVREGTTTALLVPIMPLDAALLGVLLWRVIQVLVELICLAVSFAPAALWRRLVLAERECGKVV